MGVANVLSTDPSETNVSDESAPLEGVVDFRDGGCSDPRSRHASEATASALPAETSVRTGDDLLRFDISDRYVVLVLELAILGLLAESPVHGYELKKKIETLVGSWSGASFGSLYPALNRLEKEGLVESTPSDSASASVPMTGALTGELQVWKSKLTRRGRQRRVYRLTPQGRRRMVEMLRTSSGAEARGGDDRLFTVKLALMRHLDRGDQLDLLRRRRTALLNRLRERESAGGLSESSMTLVRERDLAVIRAELEWLTTLMKRLDGTEHEPDSGIAPDGIRRELRRTVTAGSSSTG
ncbi:MAG: hypothetical protein KatS3mg008_1433 [Acidimicrobiales bacterium]|nr:MAG: hypothetical protein KatS3mg008_1433 [Acidimicrobiales bacterium]